MKFIGIDGCKDGWFCVSLDVDEGWSYRVIPDAQSLAELLRHAGSVLIDIPIGLLDTGTSERSATRMAGSYSDQNVVPAYFLHLRDRHCRPAAMNRHS